MNKTKKIYIFIIAMLIIVIVLLVGYIIFDKLLINETTNNTQIDEIDNKELVTINDYQLEHLINNIHPWPYIGLIYDVEQVKVEELSSSQKIIYSWNLYQYQGGTNIFPESIVKESVEEIFGPASYERADFTLGCGVYTFDEDTKQYINNDNCIYEERVFTQNITDTNVVVDYNATKNKLTITTAYAFFKYDNINKETTVFKDYNLSIKLGISTGNAKEYVKANKDKFYHLIYTFESNDGINYYFKELKNTRF